MSDSSPYLFVFETKPSAEMSNPNGWLGAVINCFIKATSWEEAEQLCLAALQQDGWIIVTEVSRGLPQRSEMTAEGIPYFDHALEHGIALQVNGWDEEESPEPGTAAPDEEPSLAAQMNSMAAMTAKFGTEEGYVMDYSVESLKCVDEIIPKYHPEGASLDSTYYMYAGYVGEVIRRNWGGEWKQTEEHGVYFDGGSYQAGPVKWVRDKFNDPTNESLAYKVHALRQIAKLGDPNPSPSPSLFPEADAPENTDGAKAMYQAPIIVFLLVAAADGNIDAKEGLKFKKIIEKIADHPNRLFKMSIMAMQADFEGNIRELSTDSPIAWAAKLARARAMAEEISPELSPGYLKALYDLGEQIGKSSGGILGFGGLGKEEKNALSMIAGLLGQK